MAGGGETSAVVAEPGDNRVDLEQPQQSQQEQPQSQSDSGLSAKNPTDPTDLHGSAVNLELLGIERDPARDGSSHSDSGNSNEFKLHRPPSFYETPPPKKPT
eukprot:CAMPEP_0184697480 /NCGR_PEP_ID=MMETSP0313-20130426/4439_1 /TAXON_ID=2792 /ORGANISM="Porphyridium aerugineum, Strain SAG 1380-2" /LENGTH=101 /DNA_ID=CAMNT_0027156287 /DNA_START=571 /DNA_END=872 /DNA_ORIENTATION=+